MRGGCCLSATWKPGDRSHLTRRLVEDVRRQSSTCRFAVDARRYLHICRLEDEDSLAALPWMQGGGRTACDLDDQRPKWSYLSAWS